ncbi:ADP-L-glycero-D-manno-heptose-6-epimerase [Fundidesulfovibrio magnetotacticus]|uniref:ADP-L-glycero-D-manno-heptose-6-epimerase n=1 Tax=Fundidesulfovibrio magnetotacticus TaxID=2730080 RepID=A0A6V8LW65_9BACT|nr:NAD-dependent epimerase/dehydratase family protein [Fundidesulfovibrio magnetotacticus]GFK94841.1 ADP-L-glycero-D-manno-heptose-6-epimerase [Fundidesulfovibrio magnetotacticus]
MKPALLVTGAGGFLGRSVLPALEEHYRVLRIASPRGALEGPDVFRADLADPAAAQSLAEAVAEALGGARVEALVHLAAALCPPGGARDMGVYHANQALTLGALRLTQTLAPAHVVNFSSLAVYPVRDGLFTEDSPVDPSGNTEGLYGLAKFDSEALFNFHLGRSSTVTNLRLTQAYGPGMQPDRLVALLAGEWRETGRVTLFGRGERVSNFVHARDVARGLAAVLDAPRAGTFNMGCARNLSYLEVGRLVLSALGAGEEALVLEERGIRARAAISTARFEEAFATRLEEVDFSYLADEALP